MSEMQHISDVIAELPWLVDGTPEQRRQRMAEQEARWEERRRLVRRQLADHWARLRACGPEYDK